MLQRSGDHPGLPDSGGCSVPGATAQPSVLGPELTSPEDAERAFPLLLAWDVGREVQHWGAGGGGRKPWPCGTLSCCCHMGEVRVLEARAVTPISPLAASLSLHRW